MCWMNQDDVATGSPLLAALSATPWERFRLLHTLRKVPAFLEWCNGYTNKENTCPIVLCLKSCLWAKPPHSLWGKTRIYFWYNPVPEHTAGTDAQLVWEFLLTPLLRAPGKHLLLLYSLCGVKAAWLGGLRFHSYTCFSCWPRFILPFCTVAAAEPQAAGS